MRQSFFILVVSLCLRLGGFAEAPLQVTFMAYNLKNYVRMDRGKLPNVPKPTSEIEALIALIGSEKPDILGVCEMGAPAEFQDFLARLRAVGLDFPYTEYVEALDTERHVALASRFPISERDSQTNLSFELDGKKQYYKRGILDVTIDVADRYRLHFVGTHLKSKREVTEDETLVRRSEAHILRLHARQILENAPASRLLVYGDLNDTVNEAPIRELMGEKGQPSYLAPIPLADRNGEKWTHFWPEADLYSRIDYILASPAVLKDIDRGKTHIPSPKNWNKASDHRPLILVLNLPRE